MTREIEKAACVILAAIFCPRISTPPWLTRPGCLECRSQWPLVQEIFRTLTKRQLPDTMPPRESRTVDGVFHGPKGKPFIFELDEKQHSNVFRATTISLYPETTRLGFARDLWIERCAQKRKLEGGGFANARPPLFPGANGRHQQRAFRDALTDLLPSEYGFAPTLRLADFEIRDWISGPSATDRMAVLITDRLARRWGWRPTGAASP